jgi:septum formation protein
VLPFLLRETGTADTLDLVMLILASASPRRRELLTQAALTFTVESADLNEDRLPDEAAAAYVQRLAVEKAQTIWSRHRLPILLTIR